MQNECKCLHVCWWHFRIKGMTGTSGEQTIATSEMALSCEANQRTRHQVANLFHLTLLISSFMSPKSHKDQEFQVHEVIAWQGVTKMHLHIETQHQQFLTSKYINSVYLMHRLETEPRSPNLCIRVQTPFYCMLL